MSGNAGWSVGGGRLSAIGLVGLFVLASMVPLLGSTAEVSADPAARHIYTFSDGSTSAIALASPGSPARNIMVTLPNGAEVLDAEVTLSGASSTGWNQVISQNRADWSEGTSNGVDPRADDLALGMASPEMVFDGYGMDSMTTTTVSSAWNDNGSFTIRQPHSSNATESRFSQQRSVSAATAGTYAGASFTYRDWIVSSDLRASNINSMLRLLHANNGTQVQGAAMNNGLISLDLSGCTLPSLPFTWSGYGIRDWAISDDERAFGLLTTYYSSTSSQYHRVVEFDIRYPTTWTCLAVHDPSTNNHGDYSGISYDRTRDVVWVNHNLLNRVVAYHADDGSFDRNATLYYNYFSTSGTPRGMVVNGSYIYFRSYASWQQDRLEAYAITGNLGSTLTKQQGTTTISANGYGLYYNGQRLVTQDYYAWSTSPMYREYGSGWAYEITPMPGTSSWVSLPMDVGETILSANMEVSWSATAAGDRVDYWVSADNGTHWEQVTNNQTIHFSHTGEVLRWKLQLVGSTAVAWWSQVQYSTEYEASGDWSSELVQTGTEIGRIRATWLSDEPTGTSVEVHVSADNGTNWLTVQNNVEVQFDNSTFDGSGNRLKYRTLMTTTDSSVTPVIQNLVINYEEGWPASVRLDIGNDGDMEYTHIGVLTDPLVASNQAMVTALNTHAVQNGAGGTDIIFAIHAGSAGRVMLSNLDITYRYMSRIIEATMEGGTIVPDGEHRNLIVRAASGDVATSLLRIDVDLLSSQGSTPRLTWESGNICSVSNDPAGLVSFDSANCTSQEVGGVTSIRLPIMPNWAWDDESGVEVRIDLEDDLGLAVDDYETTDLNLRIENDIVLGALEVKDEEGRVLLPSDWMRGGRNATFSGTIAFEDTARYPKPGEFGIRVVGQNLTLDGQPLEEMQSYVNQTNPSYGLYSMSFQTPFQSSPGGMLFQVETFSMQNGSTYVNPNQNTVKLVLDGVSPLVIGATPSEASEMHAGSQPISIMIQDSVDPPDEITVHYWIENQSDLNYNNVPDPSEYSQMLFRSPEIQAGGINIFNGIIDDSWNVHKERVSIYVTGQDTSGNSIALGGEAVCPEPPSPCNKDRSGISDWTEDLTTYITREEFEPRLISENSTIIGHDDETPLHPGIQYTARLRIQDGNGWNDIRTIQLALAGDLADPRQSIYGNVTLDENGATTIDFESGGDGLAVSNLYTSYGPDPFDTSDDPSTLFVDLRFQLTWWFPEEFDTDGLETFIPVVEVTDWPCNEGEVIPCHDDRGGLGFDEWSLDNDLRFDMEPGHLTAVDLATGRNVFVSEGGEPALIASGQVVRIEGRLLFSEDQTPAPGGACDIVVEDLENTWSAVPRDDGHFTLDILVPNLQSGYLDASMILEALPGLATDETTTTPRLQLSVDGTPPEIDSISPNGDVRIDQANQVNVNLFTTDSSGFDESIITVLHYRIRAGSSEISRGSSPLSDLTIIQSNAMWSGKIDFTDGGATPLLPGYIVDVWVTGADRAGNPYENIANSELQPFDSWRLVRVGPSIDLPSSVIRWSEPSPVGGENVTLSIEGVNEIGEEGMVQFQIQKEINPGIWADVGGASTELRIMGNSTYNAAIEMTTETVQQAEVERFRLVARDGHIDVDMMTLESLQIQPYQARDGEALAEQIETSQMTFLLYLAALFGLIFGTIMLVLYRQEMNSESENIDDDVQGEEQTALVEAESKGKSRSPPPPPPGISASPPPLPPGIHVTPPSSPPGLNQPVSPPAPVSNPSPPAPSQPAPLQWTDEQLTAQGWSAQQISTWRAQQAQTAYSQGSTSAEVTGGNTAARFSERVVDHVMRQHGITDRNAFLAAAEFFDSDGNRYLTTAELSKAAEALGEAR
ncbi:MAG: hypothetical protein CMB13_06230 [Euryarchaeota archaeon]|nr:hypothetical protein [Euryarchaeota archaeon]